MSPVDVSDIKDTSPAWSTRDHPSPHHTARGVTWQYFLNPHALGDRRRYRMPWLGRAHQTVNISVRYDQPCLRAPPLYGIRPLMNDTNQDLAVMGSELPPHGSGNV